MSAHPPVMDVLPRHAIPKEPPRVKLTVKEPKKTQDTKEIQDDQETKESQDEAPNGIDDGAKRVDGDKAANGDQTDLATVLRRMTDLEKKLREMEESVKKVTDDNSSVNEDLDDIEPFGSASTVKIIPFMSPKKINLSANEPGIRKHAIVAQYEVPPSWKGDLAKLNASDVKGPPLNITINSAEIITLLKTVSGTTMKAEPCVMLPPYKVLVTHWDDILEKLKTFEDEYREAYGAESLDEIESTEEKEPEKPEKPEKSEKASVLSKEESKKREEADEKRKNKREIVYTRCLVEFVRTFLKDILDLRTTIRDRSIEKIRFDDLWHLYNPGDIVVNHEQGELRAYQVVSVTKGRRKMIAPSPEERQSGDPHLRNSLRLQCYFMAYNGDVIDKQQAVRLIAPYEGEKRITDLDYCPFAFHQAASSAESEPSNSAKALVERGIRFLRYRHAQGSCDAMSLRPTEHVEGQVIVDFKSGYEEEFPKPELGSLKIAEYSSEETYESSCTLEGCTSCSNYIYADEQLDIKRAEGVLSKLHRTVPEAGIDELITKLEKKIEDAGDDISEDAVLQQALLLQHDFLIFSLRTKRWHFIDVKDFEPDTRTDKDCREGFDNLVIDKGHKRLLLAIVNDHAAARPVGNGKTPQRAGRSIDLTAGKGNGRIIFLYGPPGVGKTSTAETIAAYNKPARPLYPITCGDLGSTPTDIENNLTKHFKLAYRWNCVLLLDEADVYLAERHHSDLARNEIVSVFLRTLEYYSGLLFLTSNREGSIDQAFKSRIHLALHYKRIDGPGTQKIWRNMLTGIRKDNLRPDRAIKVEFDEDDLLDWAREHYSSLRSGRNEDDEGVPTWNGRQIRNAFHSALALASYDRSEAINKEGLTPEDALRKARFRRIRLGREHFDDISSVVKVFERYLIQCGRGEQNAENECLRVDDFGNQQQPTESESRGAGGSSRRQESRTRGTYARGPYDAASDEDDDYASDA